MWCAWKSRIDRHGGGIERLTTRTVLAHERVDGDPEHGRQAGEVERPGREKEPQCVSGGYFS